MGDSMKNNKSNNKTKKEMKESKSTKKVKQADQAMEVKTMQIVQEKPKYWKHFFEDFSEKYKKNNEEDMKLYNEYCKKSIFSKVDDKQRQIMRNNKLQSNIKINHDNKDAYFLGMPLDVWGLILSYIEQSPPDKKIIPVCQLMLFAGLSKGSFKVTTLIYPGLFSSELQNNYRHKLERMIVDIHLIPQWEELMNGRLEKYLKKYGAINDNIDKFKQVLFYLIGEQDNSNENNELFAYILMQLTKNEKFNINEGVPYDWIGDLKSLTLLGFACETRSAGKVKLLLQAGASPFYAAITSYNKENHFKVHYLISPIEDKPWFEKFVDVMVSSASYKEIQAYLLLVLAEEIYKNKYNFYLDEKEIKAFFKAKYESKMTDEDKDKIKNDEIRAYSKDEAFELILSLMPEESNKFLSNELKSKKASEYYNIVKSFYTNDIVLITRKAEYLHAGVVKEYIKQFKQVGGFQLDKTQTQFLDRAFPFHSANKSENVPKLKR